MLIRFKYSKRLCKAMNLPDNERRQFLRLYNSLLIYVNNKYKIVENLSQNKDIFDRDPEGDRGSRRGSTQTLARSIPMSRKIRLAFQMKS